MRKSKNYSRMPAVRLPTSNEPLTGYSGLLRVLSVASIMMCALSVMSCKTQERIVTNSKLAVHENQTQQKMHQDSTRRDSGSIEIRKTLMMVPPDTAAVTVAMSQLDSLPSGGNYTAKVGRTQVTLTRIGNRITATAITDSLQREVEYWKRAATVFQNFAKKVINNNYIKADSDSISNNRTTVKKHTNSIINTLGWIAVVVIALVIVLVVQRVKKKIII